MLVICCLSALAQTSTKFQGTVVDEKGIGIPGVSVAVKDSKVVTGTDTDGKFAIDARPGQVLIFRMVGYKNQELSVGTQKGVTIQLVPSTSDLEEVVVVGYGQQKKGSITGAVSTVTSKEIVTTKNENIQNMLTGKIAGVRSIQNSSEPGSFNNTFDVRGLGSPLVVIDGIVRNNFSRLNPEDVESITVLKDASAAIYGVRSANGVVLITTKKGKKGQTSLTYNGSYSVQTPSFMPKSVDILDYMTLANEIQVHNIGQVKRVISVLRRKILVIMLQERKWLPIGMRLF